MAFCLFNYSRRSFELLNEELAGGRKKLNFSSLLSPSSIHIKKASLTHYHENRLYSLKNYSYMHPPRRETMNEIKFFAWLRVASENEKSQTLSKCAFHFVSELKVLKGWTMLLRILKCPQMSKFCKRCNHNLNSTCRARSRTTQPELPI